MVNDMKSPHGFLLGTTQVFCERAPIRPSSKASKASKAQTQEPYPCPTSDGWTTQQVFLKMDRQNPRFQY